LQYEFRLASSIDPVERQPNYLKMKINVFITILFVGSLWACGQANPVPTSIDSDESGTKPSNSDIIHSPSKSPQSSATPISNSKFKI